jgi:hypothetical protein
MADDTDTDMRDTRFRRGNRITEVWECAEVLDTKIALEVCVEETYRYEFRATPGS